jgi:hypothetical protein
MYSRSRGQAGASPPTRVEQKQKTTGQERTRGLGFKLTENQNRLQFTDALA